MQQAGRPRILHVVDSLERGGLERLVVDLAIAQRDAGADVSVFSINDANGLAPELEAAGLPVIIGAKRRSFDLAVLRRLRAAATGARAADIVHAHNFVPNYYAAAALTGASFSVDRSPVLVGTCHDMGTRLANRRLRWLYRWSLGRTAGVAMVGRQVYRRFVDGGYVDASRATTVLNGVAVERFAASPVRQAAARAALGLDPGAMVIGCVGRLVEIKNHRLLIDALPALRALEPSLQVALLGGGPLLDDLRRQAAALGVADRVRFCGERSDVASLLPAFDIFVLPSLSEGLSIALLEAGACALPIVASAVGGNVEIIEDRKTGLLFPAGDRRALFDALGQLIAEPELRSRLGCAVQTWVRAHASLRALREAYDDFYRRAIRASRR